jgi:two-component system, chemotaxis family, chemotaxis protein CheY
MRPLVLIVDDTPLARLTLRRTLEEKGFHIVEAGSTQEAIRVYRDEWPDIVTMDMLMDGPNGIVAIQALKHIDHNAKIIVCSATSDKSFVSGAVTLGVEAYLNKPVDPERLLSAIRTALAAPKPEPESESRDV